MIIYIRHAQRGDNQLPQVLSSIPHDPPIIPQAQKTINQSSKQLIQILKNNNIKKIKIISSKFLRCLMTAKAVQNILKQQGSFHISQKWELNNGICEMMRPEWFKQHPLKNPLIYQNKTQLNKYVQNISFKQHQYQQHCQNHIKQKQQDYQQVNLKNPKFPQTYVDFHNRTQTFRHQLSKRFPKQDQCYIVFTHGFVVRQFSWKLDHFPDFMKQIKYCGYVISKVIDQQQVFMHAKL